MRIDKYLTDCGICSRREAAAACAAGRVQLNGHTIRRAATHVDPATQTLTFDDKVIPYQRYHYVLLNKPTGVVSATEDPKDTTVLDLLPPEYARLSLFPCGRLDKNTTGLVLLTDDGPMAHRLLSPAKHVEKEYSFTLREPLTSSAITMLQEGVDIGEKVLTKPCRIRMETPQCGHIILTEGKYHQIKRMMQAVGCKILTLHRERFGALVLEPELLPGMCRPLTQSELDTLRSYQ